MASHADRIKEVLASSYELSRAELIQRSGLTRAQVRKALPILLKTKEVERHIDENGVEWLSEGKEDKQCVEQSQGSGAAQLHKEEGYDEGYSDGYAIAWAQLELAIGIMIRKHLGISIGDRDE